MSWGTKISPKCWEETRPEPRNELKIALPEVIPHCPAMPELQATAQAAVVPQDRSLGQKMRF